MGSVKSSSTDYKSKKPNPKSLAYIGSKKSRIKLAGAKNELFHFFFTFFTLLESLLFHPKPWFPKTHKLNILCQFTTIFVLFTHKIFTIPVRICQNLLSVFPYNGEVVQKWTHVGNVNPFLPPPM